MARCNSSKVACNLIEITLRHGCSPVNLLHILKTPFSKNTSGRLLLKFVHEDSPDIVNDVFQLRQNAYNLRNFDAFATDVARNNYLLNFVVYRANQLFETLPFLLKNSC